MTTRKPAAYLVNRAYIQGVPFYVDERVIVPRSFIGELLMTAFAEDNALIGDPGEIAHSARPLHRRRFAGDSRRARVSRTRASRRSTFPPARSKWPRAMSRSTASATALRSSRGICSRRWARRYDLILTNPPYVDAAAIADFPPEYAAEPTLAHAGGADGLDIVRRILREAPEHLTASGTLICEVGGGAPAARAEFPHLPFVWLDTEDTSGEVFLLRAGDLPRRSRGRRGKR